MMRTASILIVTNGPLCRNPRVVKEAETLGRAGHAVTVLHMRNHSASEALDCELMRDAAFRRDALEMRAGAGAGAFGRRLMLWAARRATRTLGRQSALALGPAGAVLRRARHANADLTIVHNELPHWIGVRLAREGRCVAADIEDWHSEDLLPADRVGRPLELLRRQERALLHELVHTTTTSHALAEGLHGRYGGTRPHVLANAFPLQPDPRTTRETAEAPPAFFWFSQRLGPGRGLELFLAAWQRTSSPSRVVLLGEPSPGYREELLAQLPEAHRSSLAFLDCVPPSSLPAIIARHDIGLALEEKFILNRDLTITNKILQYLNAGLAIVATDTRGQREALARSPEAGVLVDPGDTARFALALDALLADRAALRRRQHAARELAERVYCWEREAPRLLALVDAALGATAGKG